MWIAENDACLQIVLFAHLALAVSITVEKFLPLDVSRKKNTILPLMRIDMALVTCYRVRQARLTT